MAGLSDTPSGERPHIAFFGLRNAGKSSLVNAVTGQDLSVVSEVPGTTTDAVKKAMEMLPAGPVLIIDTPGFDDEGALGQKRVDQAKKSLRRTDLAVLVIDGVRGITAADRELFELIKGRRLPLVIALNKADALTEAEREHLLAEAVRSFPKEPCFFVSAYTHEGITDVKEAAAALLKGRPDKTILEGIVRDKSRILLVIPIDDSAPKGRLILPQQMVLRECLDRHLIAAACQVDELEEAVGRFAPELVITDSQVFAKAAAAVPKDIPLTSFSILMARYKGSLGPYLEGAETLKELRDGDRVLIAEGCTHHRQCGDIGRDKIPAWIRDFAGCKPQFEFVSGGDYPEDLNPYRLIVHCGGCMLNEKEMAHRLRLAEDAGVPIVNYGIAIASMKGILERAVAVFE